MPKTFLDFFRPREIVNIHTPKIKSPMPKVLFICKSRHYGSSYGLLNSCQFVINMLLRNSIQAEMVIVTDNNDIDAAVTSYQPTHVIIEALWVVPEKFQILKQLHPDVKWIVRIHSKGPFLSQEGIATDWMEQYLAGNVQVAVNNKEFFDDLANILPNGDLLLYLPNVYEPDVEPFDDFDDHTTLEIGCFGAIRQLKNQYQQAIAAIRFADVMGLDLNFHMNNAKIEDKEAPILKNIQALFTDTNKQLILHDWTDHTTFLQLVSTMDLGMQVSFSESFNITSADFVYENIPIIVSNDVTWMDDDFKVSCTDTEAMIRKLEFAYNNPRKAKENKKRLEKYNKRAEEVWLNELLVWE